MSAPLPHHSPTAGDVRVPRSETRPSKRTFDALLAATRRGMGADVPVDLAGVDWEQVLELARLGGVEPVIVAGLRNQIIPNPYDPTYLARFAAMLKLRRSGWQEPSIRLVLNELHRAGLDPIVLKGPAVAGRAYPAPTLRAFDDLDLLMPRDQIDRAQHVLLSTGFHESHLPGLGPDHHHAQPLHARGITVELHWDVLSHHPYRLSIDRWRARAIRSDVAGVEVLVLSPEDALVHACVHLAWGDRYQRRVLRTLTDLLAITSACDLNWDRVVAETREARASGAVYWPLRLSRDWLDAPVPAGVLRALQPALPLRMLVEMVARPSLMLTYRLAGAHTPGHDRVWPLLGQQLLELSLYAGIPIDTQLRLRFPRAVGRAVQRHHGFVTLADGDADQRRPVGRPATIGPGAISSQIAALGRLAARVALRTGRRDWRVVDDRPRAPVHGSLPPAERPVPPAPAIDDAPSGPSSTPEGERLT